MKVEKRQPKDARLVLLRMCADTAVCGPIAAKWDSSSEGLFGSRAENLIAGWAVKHYKKFGKAPKQHVGLTFDRWAATNKDEETIDFIGSFLESLSREFKADRKKVSAAVILDLAAEVFDKVNIERIAEGAKNLIAKGNVKEAAKLFDGFRHIEVATTAGDFLYQGGAVVRNALKDVGKSLIQWEQPALREFFGSSMARDEFITFCAGEKVGKSFWLQEIQYQAIRSGCKVAFFETGDQSRNQLIRRLAARAADRPFKIDEQCRYPISMEAGEQFPTIEFETRCYDKVMTDKEADFSMKQIGRKYGERSCCFWVYPNSTLNMAGIEQILQDSKRNHQWFPDVVIIDYMDILAPLEGRADTRDQINATWKAARSLCTKLNCLLVTATQADAQSYGGDSITKRNFSEDKRKNGHVTGEIGIAQTDKEKKSQLCRLNWAFARDNDFMTNLYCAECRAVANPAVLSCFN